MSDDLPLPHDWAPKDEGSSASSSDLLSFDFTGAPSSVGTPAPSPTTTSPGPEVTPALTEEPNMPVISIKLNMGGNAQQRLEAVNSILALIAERLKVKGKAHKKGPANGVDDIGTAGANNGQGNSGQNGNNGQGNNGQNGNNGPPGDTSGTNETANNSTAPTISPGNSGANGQGSGGAGSSTPSNGQGSNNPFRADKGKLNNRQLDRLYSSRMLEEEGVLCVEGTEQEETDIDLENYADEAEVRALVEGLQDGSTPLNLADGTPVRDTICHAETIMSMVAVPFSDPGNGSDLTGADGKGSGLSADYVILIAVLGGIVVLSVGILLFRRRSAARVTQI